MCGRSRCTLDPQQVHAATGVPAEGWVTAEASEPYEPTYNLTPGHVSLVMRLNDSDAHAIQPMRWGLVPSFNKKDTKPDYFRMFNARSETVAEKSVFSRLLHSRRCIVLLNGFYEWKKDGTKKQPYYVHLDEDEIMFMAGLYDCWTDADGRKRYTYTILTTDSSKQLAWLHDRMPVILRSKEAQQAWLAPGEEFKPGSLSKVSGPYSGPDLVWHAVDAAMGSPKVQGPSCCRPLRVLAAASFFKPHRPAAKAGADSKDAVDADVKPHSKVAADVKPNSGKDVADVKPDSSKDAADVKPDSSKDVADVKPDSKDAADVKLDSEDQGSAPLPPSVIGAVKLEQVEDLPLNPDDNAAAVSKQPDSVVKSPADSGIDKAPPAQPSQAADQQKGSRTADNSAAACLPSSQGSQSPTRSSHRKRVQQASDDDPGQSAAKKAKSTPSKASRPQKTPAEKGQRTMEAFFHKTATES